MAPTSREKVLTNWSSQARKGVLELIVMTALSKREFYGYELVEYIVHHSQAELSDGTLYAILTRLKGDGLVRTRWEAAQKGPARKYYSLTPEGKAALAAMETMWAGVVRGVRAIQRDGGDHV